MVDEQTKTLSLKAAYLFGEAHGLESEINNIRNMVIEWDSSYTSSLRRGYIVELFEKSNIFEDFKNTHWSFGNTSIGETQRLRYLRIKKQYEDFLFGNDTEPDPDDRAMRSNPEETLEFAMEAHLRDFLAKNLERIEPGLHLYSLEDRKGIEFSIDGGRIDLLAVDQNGKYVVIELKLSKGRNRALGQLLYYMGWVDQNMGNAPCRGLIISSEITKELSVAVSRVQGISLAKYQMNFSVELVPEAT